MATTFSYGLKNALIGSFTGASTISGANQITYFVPYSGTQPADPYTTPVGSAACSSYSYGNYVASKMSTASQGLSVLNSPAGPQSASYWSSVSSLTFVRIYGSSGAAIIDTPISTAGGGGGAIYDSLNSSAGVGCILSQFSVKIPTSVSSTLKLSATAANALANNLAGVHTTPLYMGISTSGACSINFYSGSAPADADAAPTGTLLASITIGASNIWGTASGGAAALQTTPSVTASNTGTIGYVRIVKTHTSLGTLVLQGSAGTSGTDFIINATDVTGGVTSVTLNDATISI